MIKKLLSFSVLLTGLALSAQQNIEMKADSIMKAYHIPEMTSYFK
ncbi:hypothetical protein [Elizabethkingia meningoseptica]